MLGRVTAAAQLYSLLPEITHHMIIIGIIIASSLLHVTGAIHHHHHIKAPLLPFACFCLPKKYPRQPLLAPFLLKKDSQESDSRLTFDTTFNLVGDGVKRERKEDL
jgi:hypothetical protein